MAVANGNKRRRRLSAFYKLRLRVGLTQEQVAELCGVTVRTVQNWDIKGAPLVAQRLVHMHDRTSLAGRGSGREGWAFERGLLVNRRAGLRFGPRTLERLPYLMEFVDRIERARLRYRDGVGPDVLRLVLEGGLMPGALPLAVLVEVVRLPVEVGEVGHG